MTASFLSGLFIRARDPEMHAILQKELARVRNNLELIASENFPSLAVLEAMGSVMISKYAEGYPGKRYYGGCEVVDEVEIEARARAKQLFKADYANVQPHSGTQMNMAAYAAFIQPGDMILSLSLAMGGHLSHGHNVNFSGKLYKVVNYGVTKGTELIDMEEVRAKALEHKPKVIVVGFTAYSRSIDFKAFREIADEVDAILIADVAHPAGLIAAGIYSDPVPFCDVVTATTHKTLRGPRGGLILCKETHAKAIDRAVFPEIQGGPFMNTIAAKAIAFGEALKPEFKTYQHQVLANARTLAAELAARGLRIVSGGTDNHLFLVDLQPWNLTGKEAEALLEPAGITCNKNAIPYDPKPPAVTSGVRIGTPAVTTRGLKEPEMKLIAEWIQLVLQKRDDATQKAVRDEVLSLCAKFPLYPELT